MERGYISLWMCVCVCIAEALICPWQHSGTEALTDVWNRREDGGLHSPVLWDLRMSGNIKKQPSKLFTQDTMRGCVKSYFPQVAHLSRCILFCCAFSS